MINIKDVTLVCVACVRVNKAINAINYSIKGINFDSIKLITNEDVESKNFEIIKSAFATKNIEINLYKFDKRFKRC